MRDARFTILMCTLAGLTEKVITTRLPTGETTILHTDETRSSSIRNPIFLASCDDGDLGHGCAEFVVLGGLDVFGLGGLSCHVHIIRGNGARIGSSR